MGFGGGGGGGGGCPICCCIVQAVNTDGSTPAVTVILPSWLAQVLCKIKALGIINSIEYHKMYGIHLFLKLPAFHILLFPRKLSVNHIESKF
jgi:hypothetical protein